MHRWSTSCTPPNCNKNLFPVYSNPIVTTNSGSNSRRGVHCQRAKHKHVGRRRRNGHGAHNVFSRSSFAPNSFLFNRQGTKAVFGSSERRVRVRPGGQLLSQPSVQRNSAGHIAGWIVWRQCSGRLRVRVKTRSALSISRRTALDYATFPVVAGTADRPPISPSTLDTCGSP